MQNLRPQTCVQWPNSEDHSKCRECHLQAKRCTFGGEDTKKGRKRKRSSKSPVTVRRRHLEVDMNTDMDEDEDGFSQDEILQQPTETSNTATYHRSTLNLQKVADSVKSVGTRSSTPKPPSLIKVPLKPGLSSHPPAPPFFNLGASTSEREQVVPDKTPLTASPPEHRVTLDRNSDVEPTTNLKNTSMITNPLPAFNNKSLTIHGSPTPSPEDPPEQSFPTLANEFFHRGKPDMNSTRPHGHPDHDEDEKLLEECQNDACKRLVAKITAERDSAREEPEAWMTFALELDALYQKALKTFAQFRKPS
ncbi:uncharacterized protein EV420DRAFT_1563583 [Desarmillaria tabescens]|uniref:Uncharacterized protein n=1 Tax=Armillaria tabescens TaxID=1929756 RepID=A0AA39MWJ9_ARMTA|nr:uncharacterized protein EV420DRAFT_1563583 [Desarmillaria tabescens]KAK0449701.1 hypothetical protein EV420DRAFT_1563583 [Desarmillaria tabescens]